MPDAGVEVRTSCFVKQYINPSVYLVLLQLIVRTESGSDRENDAPDFSQSLSDELRI